MDAREAVEAAARVQAAFARITISAVEFNAALEETRRAFERLAAAMATPGMPYTAPSPWRPEQMIGGPRR